MTSLDHYLERRLGVVGDLKSVFHCREEFFGMILESKQSNRQIERENSQKYSPSPKFSLTESLGLCAAITFLACQ